MRKGSPAKYLIYYLCVLLITAPHYLWGVSLYQAGEWSLAPFYRTVGVVEEFIVYSAGYFQHRSELLKTIQNQKKKIRSLRHDNNRLTLRNRRNRGLRSHHNLPRLKDALPEMVLSELIHTSYGAWERTFRINRGNSAGIQKDAPVLHFQGDTPVLYGLIDKVSSSHSRGILTSDPRFRIGVVLEGIPNRQFVARGAGSDGLIIEHFPRILPIKAGIRVKTAPSSSLAPDGLWIGTVQKISESGRGEKIGRKITIKPALPSSHPHWFWVISNGR